MRLNSATTNGVSMNSAPLRYVLATVLAAGLSVSNAQATVQSAAGMVSSGDTVQATTIASDTIGKFDWSAISGSSYYPSVVLQRGVLSSSTSNNSYSAVVEYYGNLVSGGTGKSTFTNGMAQSGNVTIGTIGTADFDARLAQTAELIGAISATSYVEDRLGCPVELVAETVVYSNVAIVSQAVGSISADSSGASTFDNSVYKVTGVVGDGSSVQTIGGYALRPIEVVNSSESYSVGSVVRSAVGAVSCEAVTECKIQAVVRNSDQLIVSVVPTKAVITVTVVSKAYSKSSGITNSAVLVNKVINTTVDTGSSSAGKVKAITNGITSVKAMTHTGTTYYNYVVSGLSKADSGRTAAVPTSLYSLVAPPVLNYVSVDAHSAT